VCSSAARLLGPAVPILVGGVLLAACGGERPIEPPPEAVPVRLVVSAPDTAVAIGGTLQFTAVAFDSAGAVVATDPVTWSVTYAPPGRITAAGVFTGRGAGVTWVRAGLATPPLADSLRVHVLAPGTVKWTWPATAVDPAGQFPTLGGPALASDGTVYVLVETGGYPDFPATLVALSPGGVVRWTRPLQQVRTDYVVVTPETERIWVVGKAAYLVAPTGEVLWDTLADPDVGPIFLGGAATSDLLAGAWGKQVVAYRAADHTLLWASQVAPNISWLVPPTLTADGGLLAKHTADTLFVFRATDGQVLRFFLDPDSLLDNRVFGVGTVPSQARYYLPTAGRLAALDSGGTLLWLTGATGLGVTEPAIGPDGSLYVQTRMHGLWALNPDGSVRWERFEVQPRWSWLGAAALAASGILYAAGSDAFYAYDTSGTLRWRFAADSAGMSQAFTGSPAIAPDGTVYTFTGTDLYAFWGPAPPEPNSPWPMWRHDAQRTGWAR
jgi:outer membrane protein assembly factor BamB